MTEPTAPTKSRRRWKTWHLVAAVVIALLLGIGIGGAGEDKPEDAALETTSSDEGSSSTTVRPTTTTEGSYVPAPADFELTVVTTEQSCYGSAGCNVSYEIDLAYIGPRPLDPDDEWTLIYEVRGGEETNIGNISVQGDRYSEETDSISTPPNPTLTAAVTTVRSG